MRLSLLDRSRTRTDRSAAAAVSDTIERARWAEAAGYERFWVAEHHAVPGIASGSPAVLLAAIGAATSRIRLGSGGVMLPNHSPIVVAEHFAMLDALCPGRVDLGVGRSLGFTPPIRKVLRADTEDAERFADDLADLQDFLLGTGPVTVQPAPERLIPIHVLATGHGLAIAAQRGLPVVVGGPMLTGDLSPLEAYRREFVPSAFAAQPSVTVSLDVLVADTDAEARRLAMAEAVAMADSRRTGEFPPLRAVTEMPDGLTPRARQSAQRSLDGSVHGSPATVRRRLEDLVDRTGADEILSSASTFDRDALRASDEALAALLR